MHSYIYASGKLLRQTIDDSSTSGTDVVMDFFYDGNGQPYSARYTANGSTQMLYYVLNAQGDVVRITNKDGVSYGTYKYDAWGNVRYATANDYMRHNPLRYRGYVADDETGFYYLQSRYYDPLIRRFINADAFVSTGQSFLGYNMFAYCGNNPVCFTDETGTLYTSGEIHNFVVEDIVKNYPNKSGRKTYMKYRNPVIRFNKVHTYGFCDIYDSDTHEIWEVKRFGGGITCSAQNALKQLQAYVSEGFFPSNPGWTLYSGGTYSVIDASWFPIPDKDGRGTYIVGYWDAGVFDTAPGIVYYDYYYVPSVDEMAEVAKWTAQVAGSVAVTFMVIYLGGLLVLAA